MRFSVSVCYKSNRLGTEPNRIEPNHGFESQGRIEPNRIVILEARIESNRTES